MWRFYPGGTDALKRRQACAHLSGLPPVVRAVLALVAPAACAAGLFAAGGYLANGIGESMPLLRSDRVGRG